jgi:hypothetical protein
VTPGDELKMAPFERSSSVAVHAVALLSISSSSVLEFQKRLRCGASGVIASERAGILQKNEQKIASRQST